MSYYNEARAHVKALKQMSDDSRRRQERRAEMLEAQNEHPLHALRIDGRSCNVHKSSEQYEAIERMDGLIPWSGGGGGQESLIDRFDARAMLDMYIPPRVQNRPKTDEELELEESVMFESYRDLIPFLQRGLTDEVGISEAERNNVAFRAEARAAATAAAEKANPRGGGGSGGQALPQQAEAFAAMGNFGAVHFQYAPDDGDGGPGGDSGEDSGEESGSDMDLEDEEDAVVHAAPGSDQIAKDFGIPFFDVLLRRELKKEQSNNYMIRPSRRKRHGKKKALARARRMAGQGLDPYAGKSKLPAGPLKQWTYEQRADAAIRTNARGSPEYEAFGSGRGATSGAGDRGSDKFEEKVEFITSFSVDDSAGPSASVAPYVEGEDELPASVIRKGPRAPVSHEPKDGIRDALPSGMDPSMEGPVALPVAGSAVQGIRAGDLAELDARKAWERRNRERQRSPDGRGLLGGRSRSRSRSRSPRRRRSRSYSRSRSPTRRGRGRRSMSRDRYRYRDRRHRSESLSRSRSRDRRRRSRSHSRSRSRDRSRGRDSRKGRGLSRSRSRDRDRHGRSNRDDRRRSRSVSPGGARDLPKGGRKAEASAPPAPAVAASASGQSAVPSGRKETPQERMKRIMAAQFNKQVQKDNLSNTQKKAQEERDRLAREQQQRSAGFRGRRYN